MKIVNIFYGEFSGEGMLSNALMKYLLAANLETSAWYNQLRSFYRVVNRTKVYVSGQLTYAGNIHLFPTSRINNITVTLIKKALIRNVLKPDANSIYPVICRGDFSVSGFNGAWLKDWCGIIHTGFTLARDMSTTIQCLWWDLSSVDPASQYTCGWIHRI